MLLEDKNKARQLKLKTIWYILYDEKLYRGGFSTLHLKCVNLEERNYILRDIHEGVYRNHVGGQSLAHKALQ